MLCRRLGQGTSPSNASLNPGVNELAYLVGQRSGNVYGKLNVPKWLQGYKLSVELK